MSQRLQYGNRFFAVKEHDAVRKGLHWDLRLQLSGQTVLSFVLNTPPHLNPLQHLRAKRVEDHKLAYLFQEWIIPADRPGAGPTALWDSGVFGVLRKESMVLQIARGHLPIQVEGQRLKGNFSLKRIGAGEKHWLWIKEPDAFADPLRRFPNVLTPEKIQELERKTRPRQNHDSLELFESFK